MPPAKRSSSARPTPSSSSRSGDKRAGATSRGTGARSTEAVARSAGKSTAAGARNAAARTATQAKSGATATRTSAKSSAAKTARAGRATAGAKNAKSTAKAASSRARDGGGDGGLGSVADQLAQGVVKPRDLVMLTRSHIQAALDDAAERGRVTRKDANDLVSELVRRGRGGSSEVIKEIESLLGRAGTATKRVRNSDSVDRIARGADRARRAAGVGPSFPIAGYDDLTGTQVQSQIKELRKPELRKVLTYERKHANRKGVVSALEKSLA